MISPSKVKQKAKTAESQNEALIKNLKKGKKNIDPLFHKLHDEVFEEINCLDCANCCKSIPPIITNADIERIAKYLKIKPSVFFKKHIKTDDDGDYVFNQSPCPFLDNNNYCLIYENRPKACREYPHTNRKNMHQILNLTLKNSFVCPAVYEIFKRMKNIIIK